MFALNITYGASNMILRWYIEWFYVWTVFVDVATTTLSSTTTTLYTTISIYDTNSAAAAASFSSISQTLSLPTPAERTNPVPVGTSPAVPGPTQSSPPSSTSNPATGSPIGQSPSTSTLPTFSQASTSSPPTSSIVTQQSSSANAFRAGWSSWAVTAFVGIIITLGFLITSL